MRERQPRAIGLKVQALREERGLSMRGLAELCGLSPNTISLIERGATSPNVSTLHQLATALKVPITALFEVREEGAQVIRSQPGDRSFSGSASVLLENLGSGLKGQSPGAVPRHSATGRRQRAGRHCPRRTRAGLLS